MNCFFFGTFNPIHLGHLMMADIARIHFGYDSVVFVPAYEPPHRSEGLLPFRQRLYMAELACSPYPSFYVSDIEKRLTTPSYTVRTLRALFPDFDIRSERVPLIIGSDALGQLGTWYEASSLIAHCLFLQACRDGAPFVESLSIGGQTVSLHTQRIDMPVVGISSSDVRERLSHGTEVRSLVSDKVADYVSWNRLYS